MIKSSGSVFGKSLKKAMPHIKVEDKGSADLFFQYLEPKERKEFFDDLTSKNEPSIELPNFGKIDNINQEISNNIKEINKKDVTKNTEEFIERFVKDHTTPSKPFLEYDKQHHKYQLKPKYDIEKMIKDFSQKN